MKLARALACLALVAAASAQDAALAQDAAPTTRPKDPPDQPAVKRDSTGEPDPSFLRQHEAILARKANGPIDLVFLGDSITANWRKAPAAWRTFEGYQPANFGIGGDATQHVLWRIENGELDGLTPKAVVMLVGGNNHLSPAPQIVAGVRKVLEAVRAKCPEARVLVIGLLPRGHDPTNTRELKTGNVPRARANNTAANLEIAKLADGDRVRYLNLDDVFLDDKGYIPRDLMADGLHPTPAAYAKMAERMKPVIDEMMR